MRNRILLALAMALLIPADRGWCQETGGPLGDPLPPSVQDPSLSNGRHFSPALTHAGVADTGPALNGVNKGHSNGAGCSTQSPCALPRRRWITLSRRTPASAFAPRTRYRRGASREFPWPS